MGKIMLNDMIFITRHGACPHEYEFDQKFKVDVWMSTDCVAKAGVVDALNLTINYADAYAWVPTGGDTGCNAHKNGRCKYAFRSETDILHVSHVLFNYRSVDKNSYL